MEAVAGAALTPCIEGVAGALVWVVAGARDEAAVGVAALAHVILLVLSAFALVRTASVSAPEILLVSSVLGIIRPPSLSAPGAVSKVSPPGIVSPVPGLFLYLAMIL